MLSILNNKKFRDTAFQIGFVGGLLLLLVVFFLIGRANLEAQGITSGFGFLERATGWDINFALIDYSTSSPYSRALLVGLINTLFLASISLTLATLIGVTVGVMRTSGNGMAELIGTTYVEVFRNIPLLLQLFFWYAILTALPKPKHAINIADSIFLSGRGLYFPALNIDGWMVFAGIVAVLLAAALVLWLNSARRFSRMPADRKKTYKRYIWAAGILAALVLMVIGRIPGTDLINMPYLKGLNYRGGLRISPELMAVITAISIYGGAYIAEIVRAGFNSVSSGQAEAAHALGLSRWQAFSRIMLPLAIRAVMPTMINQYVWLLKATTIGIAIGFADFFMIIAISINQSGQTLELIGILMAVFLTINYSMAWVLNRVNNAIKLKGTQAR